MREHREEQGAMSEEKGRRRSEKKDTERGKRKEIYEEAGKETYGEKRDTDREEHRNKRKERWLHWLGTEVAVEYKACLYFFVILFYYAMYRVFRGIYTASLIHMTEIIFATYGMGYLQVLVLDNFDEAEQFRGKELGLSILCAGLYTGISYLFGWFDREAAATGIFAFFCMAAYGCAFLANKAKRYADTMHLNAMLRAYQKGGGSEETSPLEIREEVNEQKGVSGE